MNRAMVSIITPEQMVRKEEAPLCIGINLMVCLRIQDGR